LLTIWRDPRSAEIKLRRKFSAIGRNGQWISGLAETHHAGHVPIKYPRQVDAEEEDDQQLYGVYLLTSYNYNGTHVSHETENRRLGMNREVVLYVTG